MNSVYVTFDRLSADTGAGSVCINEIDALHRVTDVKQVITRKETSARISHHYPFNPFLFDYFSARLLEHKGVDLAHLSCSPANAILDRLQPEHYVVNCPAHNLEDSIREHEDMTGKPYPFIHNTDPYLRDALWGHMKDADSVITPSDGSAEWIKKNIKPKRVTVIPHGLTLPDEVAYPEEFTNIAYIGAWGPDKGVKYLVDAWSKLDYDDSVLYFFGKGVEKMKPVLEKWATGGKYHLYGGFNRLEDIMHMFSVYAHPSVSEGYGMTLPEAMAHGRVVVGSTGTGSSMLIEDGKNGFTFPPRGVDALVGILDNLKNNFSDYKHVAREARKTAEQYSWEKIKKRYINLYSEILGGRVS